MTIVNDSFSGSGALSANWSNNYPSTGYVQVGGVLRCDGTNLAVIRWMANTFAGDQYAKWKLVSFASAGFWASGPIIKSSSDSTGYRTIIKPDSISVQDIGSADIITATGLTVSPGDTIELRAVGSVVTLYQNGTQIGTATPSTPLTGTYIGFGVHSTDTGAGKGGSYDDFEGGDILPAATATTNTGPSSGTVGVASSDFTAGADGAITGTVIVTPSDGGGGGTFTPTTVSISSGTPTSPYTYTAASPGAKTITTTNNGGLGNPPPLTYTANAADTTAPTLTSPTGTSTGTTTASGTVTTDEANGILYALATINATETAATVKASANTQAITTTGSKSVSFTGLTASTTYYAHYVHRDAAGNDSTRVSSASFTTSASGDSTPPTLTGAITPSAITSSGFTISWPAGSDNVAVTGYEYSLNGGSSWTDAGNVLTKTVSGLTASTPYSVQVRPYDAAGNRALTPLSATITTSAAPGAGTITTNPMTTPNGLPLTSHTAHLGFDSVATGQQVLYKSSQVSHATTGRMTVTDIALVPGTDYCVTTIDPNAAPGDPCGARVYRAS